MAAFELLYKKGSPIKDIHGTKYKKIFHDAAQKYFGQVEDVERLKMLSSRLHSRIQGSIKVDKYYIASGINSILKYGASEDRKKFMPYVKKDARLHYAALYPLHGAVKKNDLGEIKKRALDENALNSIDNQGRLPVHFLKSIEAAELFVSKGCDLNQLDNYGASPLYSLLVDREYHELRHAEDIAVYMYKHGARIFENKNLQSPIFDSTLYHYEDDKSLGFRLMRFNNRISMGCPINVVDRDGRTPLFLAVASDAYSLVSRILDLGLDINHQNKEGDSSLMLANDAEIVRQLITKGASISLKNKCGETGLHKMFSSRSVKCIELLIEEGIDVNSVDNNGMTSLHKAVSISHPNTEMIAMLLENGADASLKNNIRKTALHIAVTKNNSLVIKLLLRSAPKTLNELDGKGRVATEIATKKNKAILLSWATRKNEAILYANNTYGEAGEEQIFKIFCFPATGWKTKSSKLDKKLIHRWTKSGEEEIDTKITFKKSDEFGQVEIVKTPPVKISVRGKEIQPDFGSKGKVWTDRILHVDYGPSGQKNEYWNLIFQGVCGLEYDLTAYSSRSDGRFLGDSPHWFVLPPTVGYVTPSWGTAVTYVSGGQYPSEKRLDVLIVAEYNSHQHAYPITRVYFTKYKNEIYNNLPVLNATWLEDFSKLDALLTDNKLYVNKGVMLKNSEGITALHVAARHRSGENRYKMMRYLLRYKPNINVQACGWTPLHFAVWVDDAKMVQLLLKAGANPAIRDNQGMSPADIAAFYRKKESEALFNYLLKLR